MRVLKLVGLLTFLAIGPLAACVVRERTVAYAPAQVQVPSGCVWVQPYQDRAGRVHAAHWRCPGTIDAY